MEETTLITIMAILIVLASFVSIVLSKLRLPSLVGFLVSGIIIANYIDLPEGTDDVISIFSNLGLIMLMFAIGMEIDISKLKTQGRFAIIIAIIQIPVMLFAGMIVGSLMGFGSVQAITFGAILSGASTAVVLAVLKMNNVLSQEKMDILVLVMIIEDISQVVMISILTPMMKGENMSTDALIVLVLSIAFFMLACFIIGLRIVPRILDWVYERSNDELISLFCMGLLFVFALLANTIGLSVAIGAFLTGVMVGMSRPKHVVEHFVEPLKTLFMAMFFISVGMEVSIESLGQNIPMIISIYVLFAVCMFIAVNIGYWVANGDPRTGWISAFSMCTMGEFAFIISKQALDYQVFDNALYSSIVGAAIVSMIMLPFLVGSSDKSYNALMKVCPKPLKSLGGSMTEQRDLFYHGLSVTSVRTKERFQKNLTNSAFLVLLIVCIEIAFFFIYDPLSSWLAKNIGSDEYTWRIAILFANIAILLEPCVRLAKFLRFTLYMIEKGKSHALEQGRETGKRSPKAYEYFSSLAVGAAMTVIIVIIVPNGISDYVHILVLMAVLAVTVGIQYREYRKELESVKSSDGTEDGHESEFEVNTPEDTSENDASDKDPTEQR